MEFNAITTEEESEAALIEVERLFEIDRNSLDVARIEADEHKNFPIPEPELGNRILYFLKAVDFFTDDRR